MATHETSSYSDCVPPRWNKLAVAMAYGVGWTCFWTQILHADQKHIYLYLVGMTIISLFVLRYGVHYRFTNKYLMVCYLGLPIRRIDWSRIHWAQYVHAWRDPKTKYQRFRNPGPVTGNIIYVTIDDCACWRVKYTPRWKHNALHPFRAFTIWLPYKQKSYYIEAFQKHYPDLEMQPLDAWKLF